MNQMAGNNGIKRTLEVFTLVIAIMALGGCETTGKTAHKSVTAASGDVSAAAPKKDEKSSAKPKMKVRETSKETSRPPAEASHYMISSANPLASKAGLEILRAGGSAVDAAIAAQMVLNLVEPQSSGIGGGAFMLHHDAKSGVTDSYDGRETAPASATPYMFLDGQGKPKTFFGAAVGGLSVGVPGVLRMMEMAHKEHGRLPWADLFAPAIKLAEEGFAVSRRLHDLIARDKYLGKFDTPGNYFYDGGKAVKVGTILTNPELAKTFRAIADGGADAFYNGSIARDIAAAVRQSPVSPGGMKVSDLSAYRAIKRNPVCLFYRIWMVCGMGPPSSGGITTIQILGILQNFDLAKTKPLDPHAIHLIAEASRLAFADRNTYIADPDFVPVPAAGLLDPGYLRRRSREISPDNSIGKAQPGMPGVGAGLLRGADTSEGGISTTHLSVIDGDGNAVSMTSSIENAFGSRLMVDGFMLNNQLTDFSFIPNRDAAPVANRAEPFKRPRSSMAPSLVFDASGKVVMAIGSPGGSSIIGYVAEAIIAALDWKLNIQQAIDLPHFVNRNGTTDLEQGTLLEGVKPILEKLGHKVRIRPMNSGLHGIMVGQDGLITGGADPRREGVALGD